MKNFLIVVLVSTVASLASAQAANKCSQSEWDKIADASETACIATKKCEAIKDGGPEDRRGFNARSYCFFRCHQAAAADADGQCDVN